MPIFDGSCDVLAFHTGFQEMLCPVLDDRQVVIMDTAQKYLLIKS